MKLFVIAILIVGLFAIMDMASTAASNNAASAYHTCNKARCLSYNSDGTARYNKVMGVTYRTFVWYGSRVYGIKQSNGWLKQTLFLSQTVLYLNRDF